MRKTANGTAGANGAVGTVLQIQRFSVNDGPGIRTAVFLKGCPLDCKWCHNPESKRRRPELSYAERLCIGCGQCARVCPQGCHSMGAGASRHAFDRAGCILCGRCADACVGALEMAGKDMSCREVMETVLRDKPFYDSSGGGLTLTGGEPLMQHGFSLSLLKAARESGIGTCVETSGHAAPERLLAIAEHTDLFLYDWKMTDEALHRQWTGATNGLILGNLKALDASGAKIVLRCPIVPGLHGEAHLSGIAQAANRLRNVREIHVMPYHRLGAAKYAALGKIDPMGGTPAASDSDAASWIAAIQAQTGIPVKKG
jgi:pyruvate formate lyase activating enzyme